jgi:hypothetical protein
VSNAQQDKTWGPGGWWWWWGAQPYHTPTPSPHNGYTAVVLQWKRPIVCYKERNKQVPMEMRISNVHMHTHTEELN